MVKERPIASIVREIETESRARVGERGMRDLVKRPPEADMVMSVMTGTIHVGRT